MDLKSTILFMYELMFQASTCESLKGMSERSELIPCSNNLYISLSYYGGIIILK